MKFTRFHALNAGLGAALGAATLAFLCGCGSGLGLNSNSSGSGNAPPPVAAASGPQLGYFWNPADATLRPVVGILGSSQIGQSVVPAGVYATAAASSASGIALLQEPDGSFDAMPLPSGSPTHLSAALAAGAQIRFSANGRSAIAFTPGAKTLIRFTTLTTAPAATAITASSAIDEAALGDSGSIAFASGAAINVLASSGASTTVARLGAFGGLAFAASDDVLFADAAANTLSLVRNASTSPSLGLVPSAALLQAPTALAVSATGHWALIANAADPSTVRIDLTAQAAPLRIACACTPSMVVPIAGTAAFRITAPDTGPLWAVDAAVSTPRSFFIPALSAGSGVHP